MWFGGSRTVSLKKIHKEWPPSEVSVLQCRELVRCSCTETFFKMELSRVEHCIMGDIIGQYMAMMACALLVGSLVIKKSHIMWLVTVHCMYFTLSWANCIMGLSFILVVNMWKRCKVVKIKATLACVF